MVSLGNFQNSFCPAFYITSYDIKNCSIQNYKNFMKIGAVSKFKKATIHKFLLAAAGRVSSLCYSNAFQTYENAGMHDVPRQATDEEGERSSE